MREMEGNGNNVITVDMLVFQAALFDAMHTTSLAFAKDKKGNQVQLHSGPASGIQIKTPRMISAS